MTPQWQPLHIFYAANMTPLLTECVTPLVRDLRARGLLRRYFFIRYWLEGPHIRLRLLPRRAEDTEEVRRVAEAAIEDFLRRRPALYDVDDDVAAEVYKEMFLAEYSEGEWAEKYGETGRIPLRANNSYHYIDYRPEYDRYGGAAGVELAEWHFEQSSDIVLALVGSANVHVRSVMLGLSTQLMVVMCWTFLRSRAEVVEFLEHYQLFWETSFQEPAPDRQALFDRCYEDSAESLRRRVNGIIDALTRDRPDRLVSFAGRWAAHCAELRARVVRLAGEGRLVFAAPGQDEGQAAVTSPYYALRILLSGYLHMTNNRLGVGIPDEIYLSYLLRRCLGQDLVAPR